jgi:hypothetical protein
MNSLTQPRGPRAVHAPGLSSFADEVRIPTRAVPLLILRTRTIRVDENLGPFGSMLICNHCSASIPDRARFCPACGDPVTSGDLARNQVTHDAESVRLVCPHCKHQSLYTVPSHGVAQVTCEACSGSFETRIVRMRSKRSVGQKSSGTRTFSVRVETLDGREDFVEFRRPQNEDFELRSKDLAAFSFTEGRLRVVQNLSVGRYMDLTPVPVPAPAAPGCAGVVVLWLAAAASAGALAF